MAYLFSKLNEAIDGQGARPSDILGQQAGGGQPAQADRETPQGPGIASQPSAVIGAGAGAQRQAAPGEAPTAVSSEARDKILQKNASSDLSGAGALGKSQDAIADTQKNLQSEADKYVTAQNYAQVGDDVIGKAVREGDEGGKQAISSLLYDAAPEAKKFGFDDSSLGTIRKEVSGYNTTDGREELIQRQGKTTRGEARLDGALLGKSGAFAKEREALIGKFGELSSANDAATARTGAAVEKVGRERESDKGRVRQALEKLRTGVVDTDFNAFREENNARQALNDKARATAAAVRAEMLQRPQFAESAGFAGVTGRHLSM